MRVLCFIILIFLASCGGEARREKELLPPGKVRLKVDDAMISKGDLEGIVLPMTWWIAIHGSDKDYAYEMHRFSKSQKLLYAVVTYLDDTKKEGHYAYFKLAAPDAVNDAMEGLNLMGLEEHAAILKRAAEKKANTRSEDLDLDDEDVAMLELNERVDARALLVSFVRAHKQEFLYEQVVDKPR